MARHLDYPDIAFHELLHRAGQRWPNRTAIVFGDQRLSFSELDAEADRVAAALHALGVRKGDRVALFMPNCAEYPAIFFGATRVGAAPTPLNPSYREREVAYQLRESGATVLFIHAQLWSVVAATKHALGDVRSIVVVGDAPGDEESYASFLGKTGDVPTIRLEPHDLAALPFSSGTTGTSKGVMLTQRNLVSNAYQFMDATETNDSDVILIFLPLYHIYGVGLMSNALAGGATQVIMERFDMEEMLRLIETEYVTELYVVPPVMLALAKSPSLDVSRLASLRFLMCAAAPLAPEVARLVSQRIPHRVMQAYGMTESSPLTHMVPMSLAGKRLESVGIAVADTECKIVELETGLQEVRPGETGEVIVAGPQIMAGYWNAKEVSSRALRNGWLYTGDVGCESTDGHLQIVDRKKEMIKYKAFSIAPAELEALLLEHPAVQDCGVTGQPDDEAGEVPRAFVVLRPGSSATPEELQQFVKDRVASYKQIQRIDMVDAIPRTPSGKILRRMLKDLIT